MLKKVTKYLRRTKSWGIHFRQSTHDPTLPPCPYDTLSADLHLPAFPELETGLQLTGFLDAAHGNDLRKHRSTTGFAFQLAGGCTQSTTATSSTNSPNRLDGSFTLATLAASWDTTIDPSNYTLMIISLG
jgi:hypothetical protein